MLRVLQVRLLEALLQEVLAMRLVLQVLQEALLLQVRLLLQVLQEALLQEVLASLPVPKLGLAVERQKPQEELRSQLQGAEPQ